ncbi:MAG: hypothetical protein NEHIOOID_01370 [Holosporales bacterium]
MGDLKSSTPSYSSDMSHSQTEHSWLFQGFGEGRPLYGLDVLKQKSSAPVLIVEGEKTCNAARDIFKDHAVITWNGGCGSVHKSDWSVLKDRDVTIWPDHDKAGETAAHKIADILKDHAVQSVSIVDLPSTLPHKWDLADPLPNDMHYDDLMNHKIHVLERKIEPIHGQKDQERIQHCLDYLYHDVSNAQKDWLSDETAESFLAYANKNPYDALKQWQHAINDHHFKPLTKDELCTYKEQLNHILDSTSISRHINNHLKNRNPYHIFGLLNQTYAFLKIEGTIESGITPESASLILEEQRKEHIMKYLKEEIHQAQKNGLDKNDCDQFLELSKTDPYKGLKVWQNHINDTSFKPLINAEIDHCKKRITRFMDVQRLSHKDLHSILSKENNHNVLKILDSVEKICDDKHRNYEKNTEIQKKEPDIDEFLKQQNHHDSMKNINHDHQQTIKHHEELNKLVERHFNPCER